MDWIGLDSHSNLGRGLVLVLMRWVGEGIFGGFWLSLRGYFWLATG